MAHRRRGRPRFFRSIAEPTAAAEPGGKSVRVFSMKLPSPARCHARHSRIPERDRLSADRCLKRLSCSGRGKSKDERTEANACHERNRPRLRSRPRSDRHSHHCAPEGWRGQRSQKVLKGKVFAARKKHEGACHFDSPSDFALLELWCHGLVEMHGRPRKPWRPTSIGAALASLTPVLLVGSLYAAPKKPPSSLRKLGAVVRFSHLHERIASCKSRLVDGQRVCVEQARVPRRSGHRLHTDAGARAARIRTECASRACRCIAPQPPKHQHARSAGRAGQLALGLG